LQTRPDGLLLRGFLKSNQRPSLLAPSSASVSGQLESSMKPLPEPATLHMRCGTAITLRTVALGDAPALSDLVQRLSGPARRNRFHTAINMLSVRQLHQMSCVDQQTQVAFVMTAVVEGCEHIVADARYVLDSFDTAMDGATGAEFAVVVDERWQQQGLGGYAMAALKASARSAGVGWLHGSVLPQNAAMFALMRRCQFGCAPDPDDETIVRAEFSLTPEGRAPRSLGSRPWMKQMQQRWSGFRNAGGHHHAPAG
jgi:acetyltransferase